MPIFGHQFFSYNSAIFGLIGLKISMGTQETIIHRLVMRNPSYDNFGPLLAGRRALVVAITSAPNDLVTPSYVDNCRECVIW